MTDNAIRMSKWTYLFNGANNGYFALFHALTMEIVFLEDRFIGITESLKLGTTTEHLVKTFSNISDELVEIVKELTRTGLIVPVDSDDMSLLQEKRTLYIRPPGLETMYLIVTDCCNLDCKYCFINLNIPEGYKHTVMNFDIGKESVDMFFANLARNPPDYDKRKKTILFYGGEPLSNFALIRQVVEYIETAYRNRIQEMGEMFQMSIVTNGTLINEEIASFMAARPNFLVSISIDGVAEVHDRCRQHRDGRGSFAETMRGYDILRQAGKDAVSVSTTIDEHNIDHLTDLLDLQKQYGFASINMNPLTDTEKRPVSLVYMKVASKRMLEYFELARVAGIYEDRIMRKLNAFKENRIHAYDCHALGSQLVVSPNGDLGVCHEGVGIRQFFFSRVNKEFDFHVNPTVAEWKLRTPLNMPQCYNCPAIGICGGGCAYAAWLRHGSIWSIDDRFCIHSLTSLEWLIWDLFKNLD
ncbi:MAG: radical SAM protein [Candidatus Taylorbacteria bacterium]